MKTPTPAIPMSLPRRSNRDWLNTPTCVTGFPTRKPFPGIKHLPMNRLYADGPLQSREVSVRRAEPAARARAIVEQLSSAALTLRLLLAERPDLAAVLGVIGASVRWDWMAPFPGGDVGQEPATGGSETVEDNCSTWARHEKTRQGPATNPRTNVR